jgi:hypothetical protein
MHTCKRYACKRYTPKRCTPKRYTSVADVYLYDVHLRAFGGFCEDLARQNTVAYLSQLQLGFQRCRIWVSMLSHTGFSHRRSVLKATI